MPRGDHAAAADAFIERHPEVWTLFDRIALAYAAAGVRRSSADHIFHLMRLELFQHARALGRKPLELNNNMTAYFARRWLDAHPEHPSFFELRGEDDARAATAQMELGI